MCYDEQVLVIECVHIVRCSPEKDAYEATSDWLKKLTEIDIPIPKVISKGHWEGFDFIILTYIEGKDLGIVYSSLTQTEKQQIAQELVSIQKKAASLNLETAPDWSWFSYLNDLLNRAEERIAQNGYFDVSKVEQLRQEMKKLESYFSAIPPTPFLDDISTKNLMIHHGKISGIVDIDEMGFGDPLIYVALTYIALRNDEQPTDYVDYILAEMKLNAEEKRAFLFYSLLYCVDFMGERGMTFMDKQIPVSPQIINRLNHIYDQLFLSWNKSEKEILVELYGKDVVKDRQTNYKAYRSG